VFGFGKNKKNKIKKGFQHSQYWLPADSFDYDLSDDESRTNSTAKAIKLASIKRSIANFVQIVTGKAIPVVFSSGQMSYTTGEAVVISASTKEKKFDAVVGLALHEGSHCKLTDFEFLKNMVIFADEMLPQHLIDRSKAIGMTEAQRKDMVKTLWNIIEDRRIDDYMYRHARGYRPYYESMYDNYFNNAQIDYALATGEWTDKTVENYINTIINVVNPHFDTRLLPDLDLIVGIMDLPNIGRLNDDAKGLKYANRVAHRISTSSEPAFFEYDKMPNMFHTICKIMEVILRNSYKYESDKPNAPNQPGDGQQDDSKAPNMDTGMGAGQPDDDEQSSSESNGDDSDDGDSKDGDSCLDGSEERKTVNGEKKKNAKKPKEDRLKKALDKQKKFLDGDVKKKDASKRLEQYVKAIEDSDATLKDVEYERYTYNGSGKKTTAVLVLKKLTRQIMESGAYPFCYSSWGGTLSENPESVKAVQDGFRKGAILAHKLQIRNQKQVTKFTRRNAGKIDKRRLAQLGVENEDVFYRVKKAAYKPVHVHLSIDASGSMSGDKLRQAMTVGIALAVAADKIKNLDVELSLRASPNDHATISIIYDSKVDKPVKIRSLFPYLCVAGTTPEGLCFEAIRDVLTKRNAEDSYFINLSDGMPYFKDYGGEWAYKHTRAQVNEMRRAGIKILSYYIGRHYGERDYGFDTMYGKDASYINVEEITGLIRTLNKLFLIQ